MREELKSRLNPAAIQSSTFIVALLFKNITAKVYRTIDIPVILCGHVYYGQKIGGRCCRTGC